MFGQEYHIQRALDGTDTTQDEVPGQVLDVLGSGGRPLNGPIQRAMEDRLDADLSNVRIHTGANAASAADAIDAKAFTCGNDVVFNSGEYNPESAEGQFLLAHELAHVTQQTGTAISMMPKPDADLQIDPDPQLEREADQAAEEALSGEEPLTVSRMGTDVQIQRIQKDEMFTALAAFDTDDSAGNFREDQNERQKQFLLKKIQAYAETGGRLAEMENATDLSAEIEAADVDELNEHGKRWKEIAVPSKSELDDARTNLEESLRRDLDQIALTDDQRDEVKSGMGTNMWTDVSVRVGATAIAAMLTTSTAGGATLSIGAGLIYSYATDNWDNTSGDIEERAQEIMEIIREDAIKADTGEGNSTGDAKSRRD
ncbi:hypothetical protein C482_05286 [Natrialba chahannaoensis JCM 10990]|uniref:eCIS core domain-containing protein n=1 Tax=Natrialba chahannaoensis JCM 10990 TaxID=1227492 RepID=M0AUM2_9EURY|nr:hypothetical protein C482_05286 [Natrialba chahannaoensis JCM 10990]